MVWKTRIARAGYALAHPWAGKNWGAVAIPRIGHEVIVSFREGDPDQPIITGRVYNDTNMPADSLPGEQHKSVIRSFGDNDIVIEDKEGDKQIHIKQACGNEIRMNENTPDIEIRQECGNEILMHAAEGIQIRDKYGNEIVLDAVAGTMKLRSPSHESVIELGKSIWLSTMSDSRKNVDGNSFSVIHGTKDEYVVGPVTIKWDGINAKLHGGLVSDTFVGGKHSSFVGYQFELNKSHKIVRGLSTENKKISGQVKVEAGADYLIKSPRTTVFGTGGLFLRGGKVELTGSELSINFESKVIISGSAIELIGPVTVKGDLSVTGKFEDPRMKG